MKETKKTVADNWFARNKSYLRFSLAVGLASVLVGVALGRLGVNGFVLFMLIPLLISVATARRYSQWRNLLGPVVVASSAFAVFIMIGSMTALSEFGPSLGISFGGAIGLSILSIPVSFAIYLPLLFVPSLVFFLLEKNYYVSIKAFFARSRANLLPSLLIGVPGFIVGLGVSLLVNGVARVPLSILAVALVISIASVVRHSGFSMLKWSVAAASLALTMFYSILSFKYGESPFGAVAGLGELLRLLLLELPSLFIVSFLVLFAVSGIFYVILKPVFKLFGRQSEK